MRMPAILERPALPQPTGEADTTSLPFVSVIMPVLNEERFIERNVIATLSQHYPPDRLELIVADGRSTDRTRQLVTALQQRYPNLHLIDNPERTVSPGLNRALKLARGSIIVRMDGHCQYPPDYIYRVVTLRESTQADTVGGVLIPVGERYIQRCVGAALASPVGVGGAALKARPEQFELRVVDTVHGGCWRRERLLAVGGFDEEMVRNQDDELSFRLRKAGGCILQAGNIHVSYHVRDSFQKLFSQFAQYGYWKVRVVKKHPQQASLRHFIPALFVFVLFLTMVLSLFQPWARWVLLTQLAGYLGTLAVVTLARLPRGEVKLWPGTVCALMLIHWGYGGGFLAGVLRSWFGPLPTDPFFESCTRSYSSLHK